MREHFRICDMRCSHVGGCCATSVIGREYSRVREMGGMAEGIIRRFLPPTRPRYACFVSVSGYFVPLAVLLCRVVAWVCDVRSADGIRLWFCVVLWLIKT